MSKRIVITGATGLIGKRLVNALQQRNDEIIIFSRNIHKAKSLFPSSVKFIEWDYNKPAQWQSILENSDAVIHLAGVNLFSKRWNNDFKRAVLESRQISTKNIVDAINSCSNKPEVFVSASGVGYYGDCGDSLLSETSPSGNDFLAEVCKVWESEARRIEQSGVRNVQIRTGLVLSTEDGALKQMLLPFKFFVGGPLGNGKQWMSWLHIDDIIRIYLNAVDNKKLNGPVNAVSPNPLRMNDFAITLGKILKRPSFIHVPKFALKIAVGEAAEVVVASQRVSADKLLDSGFKFKFETLELALTDLLK